MVLLAAFKLYKVKSEMKEHCYLIAWEGQSDFSFSTMNRSCKIQNNGKWEICNLPQSDCYETEYFNSKYSNSVAELLARKWTRGKLQSNKYNETRLR